VTDPANYQTAFPQGPIAQAGGRVSLEWQRFFLNGWNRTGGAPGVDMTYEVTQIDLALNTAQAAQKIAEQAETDAQTGITDAKAAQDDADTAQKAAEAADADAKAAQQTANTAVSDAEGVLVIALLTSSANQATAGHILDEAALLGVLNRTCPSQQ